MPQVTAVLPCRCCLPGSHLGEITKTYSILLCLLLWELGSNEELRCGKYLESAHKIPQKVL